MRKRGEGKREQKKKDWRERERSEREMATETTDGGLETEIEDTV